MDSGKKEAFFATTGADGRAIAFIARGKSMVPFIEDGDRVEIQLISGTPRTGDVILLKQGSRFLLHRIIARTSGGVITRGDACLDDDGLTAFDKIVGRVACVQGRGYNFHLRFPAGYLIAACLGLRKIPYLFRPLRSIAKIILHREAAVSRQP